MLSDPRVIKSCNSHSNQSNFFVDQIRYNVKTRPHVYVSTSPPPPCIICSRSPYDTLSRAKIGHRVSTLPLPMRVISLTGYGEFFDRGDPVPRQATVVVRGVEDPRVRGLKLDELLAAALAERSRRRNLQVGVNEGSCSSMIYSTPPYTSISYRVF